MKPAPQDAGGEQGEAEYHLHHAIVPVEMPPMAMRVVYITIALVCLVIAAFGAVLPLLPAAPFLLISAWAASRGSRRIHDWIFAQPALAKIINDWREQGAIPLYAKWMATIMMSGSISLLVWREAHWGVVLGMLVICGATAIFLWTRPNPRNV